MNNTLSYQTPHSRVALVGISSFVIQLGGGFGDLICYTTIMKNVLLMRLKLCDRVVVCTGVETTSGLNYWTSLSVRHFVYLVVAVHGWWGILRI